MTDLSLQAWVPGRISSIKQAISAKCWVTAGIVHAPNGQRYIVVILANRPYNSVKGKEFIVAASDMIYKYLVKG